MADLDTTTPDFLASRGITRVSDNVPEGHRVSAPKGLIFAYFGKQLMAHLQKNPLETPGVRK